MKAILHYYIPRGDHQILIGVYGPIDDTKAQTKLIEIAKRHKPDLDTSKINANFINVIGTISQGQHLFEIKNLDTI